MNSSSVKRSPRLVTVLAAGMLLLSASALASCGGAKAQLSPDFASARTRGLAMLPVKAPADINEKRIQYLEQAVLLALKSRGYTVVDPDLVKQICKDSTCADRSQLFSRYGIEALAEFEVKSVSRINFALGYYNTIDGTLKLINKSGTPLVTVDNTERERGGLVFNSGQVLEGLIDGVKNFGDDSFNKLADKFTRSVVAKLPEATGELTDKERNPVVIGNVDLKTLRPDVYQVCADATPASQTAVIINRYRSNLREVSSGKYCGIYRLDAALGAPNNLLVESRSPFGVATRREVFLESDPLCSLDGKLRFDKKPDSVALSISCEAPKDNGGAGKAIRCVNEKGQLCTAAKFYVYRSNAEVGPFEKIAELRNTSWSEALKPDRKQDQAFYQVVAVGDGNSFSSPGTSTPSTAQ